MEGFVKCRSRTLAEASDAGLSPEQLIALVRQTRSAGLKGGAVLGAIRRGDWRELIEHRAPQRRLPPKDPEIIRTRAVKDYRAEHGPATGDDPPVLAQIARRLIAAGMRDQMTQREAEAAGCTVAAASEAMEEATR